MSLQAFCEKHVVTISPERTIAEACWLMKDKKIGCLVVESHGKLCGILTDRDIVLKVTGEDKEPMETMVEEVMTRDPVRISKNRSIRDLVFLMHTRGVRRVPIVDGSETILGMVTMDDLIELLSDELSELGKLFSEKFGADSAK